MLTPLELLERERLNHLHFIEKYRDPEVAGYVHKEVNESYKQVKQLDLAIEILIKEQAK